MIAAVSLVAACGGGTPRTVAPFRANPQANAWGILGVVGDEPRAVLAAREAVMRPGTAADVAVALYFAMTVTLPSTAGLGGGGVCLVFDPQTARTEAFDFAPRPVAVGPAVVPVAARGMFAMQAKYGRMRWEQLLAPAEKLARFGFPVSRALATDVAAAAQLLGADADARRLFLHGGNVPLAEGEMLVQPELAETLGSLRARGPGDMHTGELARRIAEGSARAGLPIALADLDGAVPQARPALSLRYNSLSLYFAPPPAAGGVTAAQIWAMAAPRWRSAAADERPHLLAEASARAAIDGTRWREGELGSVAALAELTSERHAAELMASYRANARTAPSYPPILGSVAESGASFVTADLQGQVVACATGMGARFGSGRMIPGTGLFMSSASGEAGAGWQSGAAMIAVGQLGTGMFSLTDISGQVVFAGAAGGGDASGAALANVALRTIVDSEALDAAIAAPRVVRAENDATVLVEAGREQQLPGLGARGYAGRPMPALGRVNALSCPDGSFSAADKCSSRNDPRAFGLTVGGQ